MAKEKTLKHQLLTLLIVGIAFIIIAQIVMSYLRIYSTFMVHWWSVLSAFAIWSIIVFILAATKASIGESTAFLCFILSILLIMSYTIFTMTCGEYRITYNGSSTCSYNNCENKAAYSAKGDYCVRYFCETHKEHVYCELEGYCSENYGFPKYTSSSSSSSNKVKCSWCGKMVSKSNMQGNMCKDCQKNAFGKDGWYNN
ncbi:MAG: hypothetical protein IKK13_03555 [Clostridia bacterium]|nr:hypothetical protein [Clostridia bacterium]